MRPSDTDLSKKFSRFAGREVNAREKTRNVKIGEVSLDEKDPAVAALATAVRKAGLELRLWIPGMAGTCDYRLNRLNAHVEKSDDGKFRIGSSFTLG